MSLFMHKVVDINLKSYHMSTLSIKTDTLISSPPSLSLSHNEKLLLLINHHQTDHQQHNRPPPSTPTMKPSATCFLKGLH